MREQGQDRYECCIEGSDDSQRDHACRSVETCDCRRNMDAALHRMSWSRSDDPQTWHVKHPRELRKPS